jgi:hypothetical protein
MFTNVLKAGYRGSLAHYLPHVTGSASLQAGDLHILETGILNDINTVMAAGVPCQPNPLLQHIAVGIHLWGGNTGRNAFVRDGGFALNCPLQDYAGMVELLMTHPKGVPVPHGNWRGIFAKLSCFRNIGVAFLTKHLAFWSRAAASPLEFPILDSVIIQTFIAPGKLPTWKDYVPYVTALQKERSIIACRPGLTGISILSMERQLFNWANSGAANSWER